MTHSCAASICRLRFRRGRKCCERCGMSWLRPLGIMLSVSLALLTLYKLRNIMPDYTNRPAGRAEPISWNARQSWSAGQVAAGNAIPACARGQCIRGDAFPQSHRGRRATRVARDPRRPRERFGGWCGHGALDAARHQRSRQTRPPRAALLLSPRPPSRGPPVYVALFRSMIGSRLCGRDDVGDVRPAASCKRRLQSFSNARCRSSQLRNDGNQDSSQPAATLKSWSSTLFARKSDNSGVPA